MGSGSSSKLTVFAYGQPPGFLDPLYPLSVGAFKICMPTFRQPDRVAAGPVIHVPALYEGFIQIVSGEHRHE